MLNGLYCLQKWWYVSYFLFELLFIGMFAFWGTVHAIYSVHSYIYSMIRRLHLPALYHKMINGKTIYGGGSIL